jgi:phosphatidylglycerophosphatase A
VSSLNASAAPEPPDGTLRVSLLTRALATGFFTGYIPGASGTWGSLLALSLGFFPGALSPGALGSLIVIGFFVGVFTAGRMAAAEGNRLSALAALSKAAFQPGLNSHPDPSIVVIDEMVGMWIALFLLPPGLSACILAFLAFRTFDIIKPPPARQLERLPGGWGIMLDDVMAGIYANILVRLVLVMIPGAS